MKTLLVIFAHPDDESHGPGATLAKYAAEGVQVHYLCATRGEAGSVDSRFLANDHSVADLRSTELQHAADALGLAGVHYMNYRDSGMEGSPDNQHPDSLYAAPLDAVAQRIAMHMRYLRPDAIITHDQYGWYGHPDHIKCYQATLRAYELLYGVQGLNAPRLYISSFSKSLLRLTVRLMPLFGRDPRRHGQNQDVDLVEIASWRVPLTAKIRVGNFLAVKDRAIACHASQQPLVQSKNKVFSALLRQMQSVETFSRIYPPIMPGEAVETSLFAAQPQPAYKLTTSEVPALA